MEDLTRAERIIQRFMDSDKLWDLGMTVLSLVVMIVVGLLILKVILKITRKALDKSRLDEVLYSFIVTVRTNFFHSILHNDNLSVNLVA